MVMLTIAYHNLGVEQEYLKNVSVKSKMVRSLTSLYCLQFNESLHNYRMARDFAERYLGKEDDITVNFTRRFQQAQTEINHKLSKISELEEKKDKMRIQHRAIS